jgi:cell wall-associated NlpC family hydrolase
MLGTQATARIAILCAAGVAVVTLGLPTTAAATGAPTTTKATAAALPTTYVVQKGDTLYTIARSLGVSLKGLLDANKMTATSLILPGAVLKVPAGASPKRRAAATAPSTTVAPAPVPAAATTTPAAAAGATTYTLQSGEGLWTVANRFGVKLGPLLKANGLTIDSLVHPGTTLIVPAGGTIASPATGASGQATPTTIPAAPATTTVAAPPTTTVTAAATSPVDIVVAFALAQLGKGYAFNSAGPDTFDCSGLTVAAYRQIGIALPHQSAMQATRGTAVDWRAEPIRAGDLVFTFSSNSAGTIGHVGLAISATQWVHAPRAGDVVKIGTIPAASKIQAVRRYAGN